MTTRDSLGDRMKRYETTTQSHLIRRMSVIARIDGRAFHTFTKRLKHVDPSLQDTPFSVLMHDVMMKTTAALVSGVQGCVLGYTQSDEISLLIRDWDTLDTQAWFDYNVQKMVSLMAALATKAFNYCYNEHEKIDLYDWAEFDCRVHNIPKEEVTNYFIWRQQDASRNSVQMLGRFHFSQKQMHGKNNSQVQDMLMLEKEVNWNNIPTWMKRGACVVRNPNVLDSSTRVKWDDEIPIFTQDRNYVEQRLVVPEPAFTLTGADGVTATFTK
jgi:tRNA(His) guanylyltransferase